MLINGTLLGAAQVKTSLLWAAIILSLLFTAVKPEASAGLGVLPRFGFWVAHIGIGLLAIMAASYGLRFWRVAQLPAWLSISMTGVLGAMLAVPLYWAMDFWCPPEVVNDWLDEYALRGLWQSMLVEFAEVMPMFLLSWYAVNLPFLLNKPRLLHELPPDLPDGEPGLDEDAQERQRRIAQLHASLPEVLGKDVVAISSDLHYLNVYTSLGKTLVLGSLKHYVEAFADQGLLVHRSNWVAKAHVVKLHIAGSEAYCLMSNGLKVPVSRSRRKELRQYFGQGLRQSDIQPQLMRVK